MSAVSSVGTSHAAAVHSTKSKGKSEEASESAATEASEKKASTPGKGTKVDVNG